MANFFQHLNWQVLLSNSNPCTLDKKTFLLHSPVKLLFEYDDLNTGELVRMWKNTVTKQILFLHDIHYQQNVFNMEIFHKMTLINHHETQQVWRAMLLIAEKNKNSIHSDIVDNDRSCYSFVFSTMM